MQAIDVGVPPGAALRFAHAQALRIATERVTRSRRWIVQLSRITEARETTNGLGPRQRHGFNNRVRIIVFKGRAVLLSGREAGGPYGEGVACRQNDSQPLRNIVANVRAAIDTIHQRSSSEEYAGKLNGPAIASAKRVGPHGGGNGCRSAGCGEEAAKRAGYYGGGNPKGIDELHRLTSDNRLE